MTLIAKRTVTFELALPPTANHGYRATAINGRAQVYKSQDLRVWEQASALAVRGWEPPKHRPLSVRVIVYLPANQLRTADLDGWLKAIVDAVVGKRRDQWVDVIYAEKRACAPDREPGVSVSVSEGE